MSLQTILPASWFSATSSYICFSSFRQCFIFHSNHVASLSLPHFSYFAHQRSSVPISSLTSSIITLSTLFTPATFLIHCWRILAFWVVAVLKLKQFCLGRQFAFFCIALAALVSSFTVTKYELVPDHRFINIENDCGRAKSIPTHQMSTTSRGSKVLTPPRRWSSGIRLANFVYLGVKQSKYDRNVP